MKMKKPKEIKCEVCSEPIPRNAVAYVNGKMVCQKCWYKKHSTSSTVEEYLKKLGRKYDE